MQANVRCVKRWHGLDTLRDRISDTMITESEIADHSKQKSTKNPHNFLAYADSSYGVHSRQMIVFAVERTSLIFLNRLIECRPLH